jgi:hypothetical protein
MSGHQGGPLMHAGPVPQGGAPHRMRAAARPAAARPLLARPPAALPCVPRCWLPLAAPAMQCTAGAATSETSQPLLQSGLADSAIQRHAAAPHARVLQLTACDWITCHALLSVTALACCAL